MDLFCAGGVAYLVGFLEFCGEKNVVECVVDCGGRWYETGSWVPQFQPSIFFLCFGIYFWGAFLAVIPNGDDNQKRQATPTKG
jgi:hypothetical protein